MANTLGNLVNRTISMANKYFDGEVINKNINEEVDNDLINYINSLDNKVSEKMEELLISDALGEIFEVLKRSNKYIDETTPWVLAKEDNSKDRLETVIYNLLEAIRVCAVNLSIFLPSTSDNIFKQLNNENKDNKFINNNTYKDMENTPLFVRIDKEEKLKEINL